jgi:PAS domain S-box-containing protein
MKIKAKLDYANLSLSKKVTYAVGVAFFAFILIVGGLIYFQMRKVYFNSEKERLEAQAAAFDNSVQRTIILSKQVLGVYTANLSSMLAANATASDTAILKWMKGAGGDQAKNLYAVLTEPSSGASKVYHFKVDGEPAVGDGAFADSRFAAAEAISDKEVGLVASSNKQSFLKVSQKRTLPDGRALQVGLMVPFQELVAIVNKDVKIDTLTVLVVGKAGDVLTSNNAEYVGKNLSALADGDFAARITAASSAVDVQRLRFGGNSTIAIFVPFSKINSEGGMLFTSPRSGINKGVFFLIFLVVASIWLALAILLLRILNLHLLSPLKRLTASLREVANGKISDDLKVEYSKNDEVGHIAESVNGLVESLTATARFAKEIGEGKLSNTFTPRSNDDLLGIALVGMQGSLTKAKELEEAQKVANQKSHWANEGAAKFAEILRNNHDNLKEMSFDVVKNLVKYVGAIQGGVFVLNDDVDDDQFLEMTACFAYDRRKMHQKRVEIGEGLVGRCFFEKQSILLKEIPDDYLEITSGLGQKNPENLILVPLKINDTINGVLEIASFNGFEDYQIQFIEKVAESISSTITSVRVNERTSALLERSQVQAEMMAAQEEEMRQNLEELQATQEELEKRARENEQMTSDLEKEKYLLDALLTNIPDYIYFKDEQSRFIRVSESMAPLFNTSSGSNLIGKSDFDFHSADHANSAFQEEMEIIRTGKRILNQVDHEVWEDGREQWVSTTKMPLVAADGRIVGTFGISKVITDIKKMELEMKQQNEAMKEHMAQMEKTSEDADNVELMYNKIIDSLPLRVFVKDHSGKFVVVNSAVALAHGLKPEELVGKSDFDLYDNDAAEKLYQAELEVMDGDAKTYIYEEPLEGGGTKTLKTTKIPFFIDTVKDKGLLGVQVDVSEFSHIHHKK